MRGFFVNSEEADRLVLRPLDHIRGNWELVWGENDQYVEEDDSYAEVLNDLIDNLGVVEPPSRYHDNEDKLAEYLQSIGWDIRKESGRWVGADYGSILEQGGFNDVDQSELILAAAGRIKAAQDRGQNHFDDMEWGHKQMLSTVLSVILYHRS